MKFLVKSGRLARVLSLLLLAALLPAASLRAANAPAPETKPSEFPQGILFPYYLLDRALDGRVDEVGRVNYIPMQGDKWLDLFVQAVAAADLSKFPVMTKTVTAKNKAGIDVEQTVDDRSPELVFWINSYNALVLSAITKAYPITSIDNIKDFDSSKNRRVAGKDYSFAEIRKKVLDFDPRAFFALCDGSVDAPRLKQDAYRMVELEDELAKRTEYHVSNPKVVQLLMIDKKVMLNTNFQELEPYFVPKNPQRKWEGIRQLLITYTSHGASQHFYINNPTLDIVFNPPNHTVNRDYNQSPVGAR